VEIQINFGTMSVGTNSSSANSTNITNEGNVQLDIQVSGNGDMSCTSGTIPVGNIHYNATSGQDYAVMCVLTHIATDTCPSLSSTFNLAKTTDGTPSTKDTYWKLRVPSSNVGRICNGTILFTAL
jgi:hypothetical protein